jgi:hypothetical protein
MDVSVADVDWVVWADMGDTSHVPDYRFGHDWGDVVAICLDLDFRIRVLPLSRDGPRVSTRLYIHHRAIHAYHAERAAMPVRNNHSCLDRVCRELFRLFVRVGTGCQFESGAFRPVEDPVYTKLCAGSVSALWVLSAVTVHHHSY